MEKFEAKDMTAEQLKESLNEAEALYQDMLYNHNVAALENSSELTVARKNIARIKTALRAIELKQQEENGELKRDRIRARRKREKKNKK
jgi:large subunit ribosomal protein L29